MAGIRSKGGGRSRPNDEEEYVVFISGVSGFRFPYFEHFQDKILPKTKAKDKIPPQCEWQELKDLVRSFGCNIRRSDVHDYIDGFPSGLGHVIIKGEKEAWIAYNRLSTYTWHGSPLSAQLSKASSPPERIAGPSTPAQVIAPQQANPHASPHANPHFPARGSLHSSISNRHRDRRSRAPPPPVYSMAPVPLSPIAPNIIPGRTPTGAIIPEPSPPPMTVMAPPVLLPAFTPASPTLSVISYYSAMPSTPLTPPPIYCPSPSTSHPVNITHGAHITPVRSVFITQLPYAATWKHVKDYLRQAGSVERCDVLPDPVTKKSKGHAKATFRKAQDAVKAVNMLDGGLLLGKRICVRLDRESDDAARTSSRTAMGPTEPPEVEQNEKGKGREEKATEGKKKKKRGDEGPLIVDGNNILHDETEVALIFYKMNPMTLRKLVQSKDDLQFELTGQDKNP
ncbi:MAG: hypothetical protein M1834_001673 [Cirrosporium novae-zelandiae]|nr:MAG: hypothetical protein M1834_001673 [Cirrosporium novae-zelandiae]